MASRGGLLSHGRTQTVVYWGSPVSDGSGGRTFATPVELLVRWEDRTEMFVDAQGREKRSRAVVLLGQDVDLGGYLYLGTLADLSSAPEPVDTATAYAIQAFAKVPDIKGTRFWRKAWL